MHSRLEYEDVAKLVRAWLKCASAPAVFPSESSTKPSTQLVARLDGAHLFGFGAVNSVLRPGACVIDPAEVRSGDGSRELGLRDRTTELRVDGHRPGRIPIRLLPVPCPPLDEAQIPEGSASRLRDRSAWSRRSETS